MAAPVRIRYPADSLADIDQDYYADMVEAMIAEYYGGEYEFDIRPGGNGLDNEVRLDGAWPEGAEGRILEMMQDAFNRCCNGDPVPSV